ncbi:MAG: rhamnosyltransferase [Planctomycetota bacterium]
MNLTKPSLSILLPTWNGEEDLRRLLPALDSQDYEGEREVLAIDSSSTDATVSLLKEAGVDVEIISQSEFGHGATRNRLAAKAKGEVLVFLSQDALPASDDFLQELVSALDEEQVAGAYSRILPHPDDDPLTARTVLSAPEADEEGTPWEPMDPALVWELPTEQMMARLRFNNVASAVRAPIFREIQFPELPFGEDFAWAARVTQAGYRIRFAPKSLVYHAHRYTPSQAFARYKLDAAFHREIHGLRLRPSFFSVMRGIGYEVREDLRYVLGSGGGAPLHHLLRSPALRTAQVLGQFWGSRGWGEDFWPDKGAQTPGSAS